MDGCTIEEFESERRDRLYVTWNRMSSGSYVPPPVKAVEVPKLHGGGHADARGADRGRSSGANRGGHGVEKVVEPKFHRSSYGYRPGRSALHAVEACRSVVSRTRGCWIVTSPGSLTTPCSRGQPRASFTPKSTGDPINGCAISVRMTEPGHFSTGLDKSTHGYDRRLPASLAAPTTVPSEARPNS